MTEWDRRALWTQRLLRPLPDAWARALMFRRAHGTWPSTSSPAMFSEKVNWRVLKDRRSQLTWTCDKLRMKEVARGCAGLRVAETYWSGVDLSELTALDLPRRWVLKPNNGSGRVILGEGGIDAARAKELAEETRGWLESDQVRYLREWAYTQADAVFLVEEFLGHGTSPVDYKVLVFDGVPTIFSVHLDRFGEHRSAIYAADPWERLDVHFVGDVMSEDLPRPECLDRLIDTAARLGAGFDFMRVDLYEIDGEVWFGEFTPYPASGLQRIEQHDVELAWGALWPLPSDVGPSPHHVSARA